LAFIFGDFYVCWIVAAAISGYPVIKDVAGDSLKNLSLTLLTTVTTQWANIKAKIPKYKAGKTN